MKKILKKIKKFFKYIKNWILFRIDPNMLSKKKRKKFEKEREISKQYSHWGNFCRFVTGTRDLKLRVA